MMARRYAQGTSVSVEKSRIEVEETLRRFGADAFQSGYEGHRSFIMFLIYDRFVRLVLELPAPDDTAFSQSPTGRARSESAAAQAYEQEVRRRWRSLCLLVKAKLAAIEDGITEFEEEFLPHIVLPDNKTVFQHTRHLIGQAYETGETPRLLPPPETE